MKLSNRIKQSINNKNLKLDNAQYSIWYDDAKDIGMETQLHISYLKKKVKEKYPNLTLIKIEGYIKEIMCLYQEDNEMIYDIGLYLFIEKRKLNTLLYENPQLELMNNASNISNNMLDKTPYINLNKFSLNEKLDIRNKILKESSIIVQKSNYNTEYQNGIISIYPCVSDYYSSKIITNKTSLVLLSLDEKFNQCDLDDLCLTIIDISEEENIIFRNSSIKLLNNMKEKILNLNVLTKEEERILNMLLNEEKKSIRKNNNILTYTLKKGIKK